MKFKALNNEPFQFYNTAGELVGTIMISGSGDMILRPESGSSQDVLIGNPNQVGDVEMGAAGIPINLKILGGGTITGNGNTLNIGSATDVVNIYNAVYSQSFDITGSLNVTGSVTANTFVGSGEGITGIISSSYALTASHALNGGGGGGGGSPGGANTQVQFNDGGSFGGDAGFTFNKTTNSITAITNITASGNISSSANVIAKTGSFSHLQGNSPITVGDQINFQQPLTASIISASSYVGSITSAATASYAVSASHLIGGGGSVPAGTVSGSSQITELGFVTSSATASFITNAETGSFLTNASTASFNNLIISHPSGNLVPGDGSTSSIAVTVADVGGNKYHLDGVTTGSTNLTAGNLYKFDQSDASNDGHPFRFSTDTGGSSDYATGVTIAGTPGNAGAYTQISVTNATPTLYYYCTNHSNMGLGGVLSIITGSVIQNGFLNITGSLSVLSGSISVTGDVTASGNVSSSGNVIASNVFLPSNGKISFDNSLDGSDQFISGVDNQIVVDGDDLIVFKADSGGYEFRDTSNAATVHITTAGAITASGNISSSGNVIASNVIANTLETGSIANGLPSSPLQMTFPSGSSKQLFGVGGYYRASWDDGDADHTFWEDDNIRLSYDVSGVDIEGRIMTDPSTGEIHITLNKDGTRAALDKQVSDNGFDLNSTIGSDDKDEYTFAAPLDPTWPFYKVTVIKTSAAHSSGFYAIIEKFI